jgi:predicted metal-dependent hydrolase
MSRALRRRYGCFRLPRVLGARVAKARRRDVSWLARTDPEARSIEFSEHFGRLSPDGKRYIVLHERAHLETGPEHNDRFYEVLKRLVASNKVPWRIAYELESYNCHKKS